jgi:predicted secreted Zn-dependent protease
MLCPVWYFEIHAQETADEIVNWKDRPLAFEDFQGSQDTTFLVYGRPAVAASALRVKVIIRTDVNNKVTASVTTIFNKRKSWMKEREAWILNHEQGHFDIEEIFARRIRKAMQELTDAGEEGENKFKELVNDFFLKKSEYQYKYDNETTHGFHHEDQALWDKTIKEELQKFREWL